MATGNRFILYVEDDPEDLFMVREAFAAYDTAIRVGHADSGTEAITYLRSLPAGAAPDLIVLDINLPGMNGKETLVRIRQMEQWKNIPVILFSTSSNDADKKFAATWDAGYMTKPSTVYEINGVPERFIGFRGTKELPAASH